MGGWVREAGGGEGEPNNWSDLAGGGVGRKGGGEAWGGWARESIKECTGSIFWAGQPLNNIPKPTFYLLKGDIVFGGLYSEKAPRAPLKFPRRTEFSQA